MVGTSASLLKRLADSADESAWCSLTDAYAPLVKKWLSRHAVPANDRDDLVQEVLVVVVRKLPGFKHNQRTGAFRSWLRSITVNCLRDFWKNNRLQPNVQGGSDFQVMLAQLEDPASALSAQWDYEHDLLVTREVLRQIKGDFEPRTWQAFQQTTFHRVRAAEVAAELGISENAVYAAKSRVLTRLRQEISGLVGDS